MLARIKSVFSSLKCYEDGICNSKLFQVMNCEGKRKRRDLTLKNIGYSTTFSCNTTFCKLYSCTFYNTSIVIEVEKYKDRMKHIVSNGY